MSIEDMKQMNDIITSSLGVPIDLLSGANEDTNADILDDQMKPRKLPAWRTTPTYWKYLRGIYEPHICEINPFQYQRLSKRGKAEYDAKRGKEWDASAAGTEAWRVEVWRVYLAGEVDLITVTREARDWIATCKLAVARKELAKKFQVAHEANKVKGIEELKVGDKVHHAVYQAGEVVRKNHATVKVRFGSYVTNVRPKDLTWKASQDVRVED